MTDVGRMSVGELVGEVLADEHADVLRQAVVWLAQELMEAEASERVATPLRRPSRLVGCRRESPSGLGWRQTKPSTP
jgi:hypothetical protein